MQVITKGKPLRRFRKDKLKMKTAGNVLFFAGFLIAGVGIGIGLAKVDTLLVVKLMTGGFATVGISCLLEDCFAEVSEYEF